MNVASMLSFFLCAAASANFALKRRNILKNKEFTIGRSDAPITFPLNITFWYIPIPRFLEIPITSHRQPFYCYQRISEQTILLEGTFYSNYGYDPSGFKVENFITNIANAINSMNAASKSSGDAYLETVVPVPPYMDPQYSYPTVNWTHEDSTISFEGFPCSGKVEYVVPLPGLENPVQQVRFSGISAGLQVIKNAFQNSGRSDANGRGDFAVGFVPEDFPKVDEKWIEETPWVGLVSTTGTSVHSRRQAYTRSLHYSCSDNPPLANVAVD